ncbi:DEAD/DEAH box helicase [Echinicola shivajiensis]|uniref:DEAD/DEAH box helicase n=1 Tax=Echinicola shivajiensis TaxID=1035916 RepID=UPI001BFC9327|nr:DEAD/DEAH box helicase [Echinicola shivajiensis]
MYTELLETNIHFVIPFKKQKLESDLGDLFKKVATKVKIHKRDLWIKLETSLEKEGLVITAEAHLNHQVTLVRFAVFPDRLIIIRDDQSEIKGTDQLSLMEFYSIERMERINYLDEFFQYFKSDYYSFMADFPSDFRISYGSINPSSDLGHIYLPQTGKQLGEVIRGMRTFAQREKGLVIGFSIPTFYWREGIPLLIPFMGRPTKDKSDIKSFISIDPDTLVLYTHLLSERQLALFEIANQLRKLGEESRSSVKGEFKLPSCDDEPMMLKLWKRAFPLLKEEPYLYLFSITKLPKSNVKPIRNSMHKVRFDDSPARVAFLLEEKEDRWELSPKGFENRKIVDGKLSFPRFCPLFNMDCSDSPKVIQAMGSLRDIKVLSLFYRERKMTVYKHPKSQDSFLNQFLPILCTYFPLKVKFPIQLDLEVRKEPLTVENKWIRVSKYFSKIMFIPYLKYAEIEEPVNVLFEGTLWAEFEGGNRLLKIRDLRAESDLRELLFGLHRSLRGHFQNEGPELDLSEFMGDYWFLEAFSKLREAGVEIKGLEKMEGFDYHPYNPDIQMDIQAEKGWFDIGLQVRFGDKFLDMEQLRKAVIKQEGEIKLKDGKKGVIPSAWRDKLNGLLSMGQEKDGKLSLSKVHFPMVERLYGKKAPRDITEWIKTKRKRLEKPATKGSVKLPKVQASLRPYQKSGFYWMKALQEEEWGGVLADDMGLGKTLQVLTLLLHTKEIGGKMPNLIVATKTLLYNWEEQAGKFTPGLSICKYYGASRQKLQKGLREYDLVITTYDTVKSDIRFFGNMEFQYLITDEAQAIKNTGTDRYKAMSLLNAQYRLALSGTPIENSVMDLYALMNFVNPGFFGTEANFKKIFLERGSGDKSPRMEALQTAIKPFILRRTKEKVAKDLPEKTEMVLYCEMEREQRKAYEKLRDYYKVELENKISKDGVNNSKLKVLEGLMRLRQVCDHPVLVPDHYDYEGNSAKMEALMEQVIEKTESHKLLVFSQFTSMLKLIRKSLEKEGVQYSYLDGQTSEASRKNAVQQFQENESVRVFLLSLKAGGSGLNLTAGDYVFLVDPWWNPAVESQAIDRCYRIGQNKKVMAYRMICKDTVEEKILQMQHEKKALASGLIKTEEVLFKSLDTKGLLELFG